MSDNVTMVILALIVMILLLSMMLMIAGPSYWFGRIFTFLIGVLIGWFLRGMKEKKKNNTKTDL